jgi:hypothetical protein
MLVVNVEVKTGEYGYLATGNCGDQTATVQDADPAEAAGRVTQMIVANLVAEREQDLSRTYVDQALFRPEVVDVGVENVTASQPHAAPALAPQPPEPEPEPEKPPAKRTTKRKRSQKSKSE